MSPEITQLVWAAVLGAFLGVERSLAGKHAGMRTYALVSLGACLFTLVGVLASEKMIFFSGINPLQLAGSVVIGIGFIGAGLTFINREQHAEVTTTSGLWISAAVGVAVGLGFTTLAVATTLIALVIFALLIKIETYIRGRWGNNNS